MAADLTAQQLADLDVARSLAAAGIPLFVAPRDPEGKGHNDTGFWLPKSWQETAPDPAVADRWRPGMALCAVMGHGLDLLDVDPRNGGDAAHALSLASPYAAATTPSGGSHLFIRSLGVGSRDGVSPGIDFKGGDAGEGHGFAFLAPTIRTSKVTGEPAPYVWAQKPDIERLSAALANPGADTSGVTLAARVRELRGAGGVRKIGGPAWWREFLASREPQSAPAADKAIREKLDEVASWTATSGADFRITLMRAAMTLGGYVGGGYLDEADAWARLEAATAQVWGAPNKDDRLWIEQGLTDGAAQPFPVYTAEDEQLYGEAAQAVAATRTAPSWSPYRALGVEPFDPHWVSHDQEFAELVAARTAPVLRYAVDAGSWLVRDAEVWREREDLSGWAVAIVARLMPLGSTPVPKDHADRTEAHWQAVRRGRFMASSGSGAIERKLRSIVRAGDHASSIELGALDSDPEILWAGGMPWDLRASAEVPTLAAIDPATPHLRSAACAPEPRETPKWGRFVAAVWPDPDLRAWALRVLSLSLAGYPDAAMPVLYGPERTGKTSLIQLIIRVLGTYGHAADPRLLAGADNAHASVVYALKGRRLSFIDEGPRRGHLAAERLKQLTGGGSLTGNAMRSNPVTFEPTHTLVMTTNDEPPVTDPALRARMRVIPCEADQGAVRAARQAITSAVWEIEAPGVLAALMRETAAWLVDPASALPEAAPAGQRGLVDEMAAGQDPAREWVTTCTVATEAGTPGRELYVAFARWFGEHPLYRRMSVPTETAFGRSLTAQGYPPTKTGGRWVRPLSVLGGSAGVMPWEPLPSPHMVRGPGGSVAGAGRVEAGSEGHPAGAENPTSSPVSSSSLASLAGTSRSIEEKTHTLLHKEYTYRNTQGNRGPLGNPPEIAPQTAPDQAWAGAGGDSPTTRQRASATAPEGGGSSVTPADQGKHDSAAPKGAPDQAKQVDHGSGTLDTVDPSRKVTNSDVARRADQAKITKAEARAQLREEQRLAAIREAQGEVLDLPAVVDRDGHVIPVTLDQAAAVVRSATARAGKLDVDVEYTGYPIGHPDYALRSVQLGDDMAAGVFDPVQHADLIRALLDEAPALGAFVATADLVPLAHAGLIDAESGWARMHDVMLAAKLADPATGGTDGGLKETSAKVLGSHAVSPRAEDGRKAVFKAGKWLEDVEVDTPLARSGWAQIATGSTAMLRYAASDVLDTAALSRALPLPDPAVYERERLTQRMTARIAHRGVPIDREQVTALHAEHTAARAEWAVKVRAFGVDNPGSDKQIGEAALQLGADVPHTAKGNLSVAKGVLGQWSGDEGALGEFVRAVLEFRHHDTLLGTFLGPYRVLCERGDGRARPTVYTVGTRTGRMSCVRPNLQQLPKRGGVRACISTDPGQLMIGADFSGVEIRVAAALSQDPTLLRFLAEGRDLHAEIALQVWGPDAKATAENGGEPTAAKVFRYKAKGGVFGRMYGGGIPTLAGNLGISLAEMQRVADTLDALTPGLRAWSDELKVAVKQGRTQYPSYSGRTIHLPREYPHKAANYCIQGTARELLIDALVRWNETRWGTCTLLPVHDELDVWVPAEDAEEATAELVRCMQSEVYGVPIIADPSKPSPFWQDAT